eukprot:m.19188 g.19188  ORF g.19188 m.19188 type:complete len:400 (-) comp11729_c0_seq2:709-1908(-)
MPNHVELQAPIEVDAGDICDVGTRRILGMHFSVTAGFNAVVAERATDVNNQVEESLSILWEPFKNAFDKKKKDIEEVMETVNSIREVGTELVEVVERASADENGEVYVQPEDPTDGIIPSKFEAILQDLELDPELTNLGDLRTAIAKNTRVFQRVKEERQRQSINMREGRDDDGSFDAWPLALETFYGPGDFDLDLDLDGEAAVTADAAGDPDGADGADSTDKLRVYGRCVATKAIDHFLNPAFELTADEMAAQHERLFNVRTRMLYMVTAKDKVVYIGKTKKGPAKRFEGGHAVLGKLLKFEYEGPFKIRSFDILVNKVAINGLDNASNLLTCIEQMLIRSYECPFNAANEGRVTMKLEGNDALARTLMFNGYNAIGDPARSWNEVLADISGGGDIDE